MNADELYEIWAPEDGLWSPWVKPVLFAYADLGPSTEISQPPWLEDALETDPRPERDGPHRTNARALARAFVVDLPAKMSIAAGIALLDHDYFPVPLFNALPHPNAVVDLAPALGALQSGAGRRSASKLSDNAPPAFLLDSRRLTRAWPVPAGEFDNRSVMFESDFPSSETLLTRGIRSVVIIQADKSMPAPDIRQMLASWQRSGLDLLLKRIDRTGPPEPIRVRMPWWFSRVASLVRKSTLRVDDEGVFGAVIPHPPSGG